MDKIKNLIPEGHKLVLKRKGSCLLCQRPEFRGDWDEVIWSRKFDDFKLMQMIKDEFDINLDPKEIKYHSKHFELIPVSKEEIEKHKRNILEDIVAKEKEMLEINNIRGDIEIDFDKDLEGKIKALSSEITDMKIQGFENDPRYLAKLREYKALSELRYKRRDEIHDETKISLAVLEVRELFNKIKELEEVDKNAEKENKESM